MGNKAERLMEADEFLLWCLDQEDKYELVNGIPVKMLDGPNMMTGASHLHDRVVVNVIVLLKAQLRGTRCTPATADIAVRTRGRGIRRPDITVTCDDPRSDRYESEDTKMVVEVLSPSNIGMTWQRKIEEYRHLAGLAYILLIDTQSPSATLLIRTATDWSSADFDGLDAVIALPDIACTLPMADIYDGVPFGEGSNA